MQISPNESLDGAYTVFYSDAGQRFIVLSGLHSEDTFTPPPLQVIIHEHFAYIESFYWALFFVSVVYMIGTHIVQPLFLRMRTLRQ